jgi:peptide-methionine (R)-S-oxide reductase
MNRRAFLGTTFLATTAGILAVRFTGSAPAHASEGTFEIMKTDDEWRTILSEAQFQVLRKEDTERPFTSPLNEEKRVGNFHCAGCDLPVYGSYAKYDSGTGWPSFYESLKDAVGTKEDNSLFSTRTEVHCRRCGGHFGHVFDDGPKPTGMRHCINGLSLTFKPETA